MKEVTKVHAILKNSPEDFIVEEIGDKWICKVSPEFKSKSPDLSSINLDDPRDFIWCELEKRDIDHFRAIKEVSTRLRKSPQAIGYAGSKDKVAITSQRISIFKPDIEAIKSFYHPNIYLKNFKWAKRKIKMGYLESNHFKIILRDVGKKDAMKISSKIKSNDWFPNYFGPQRFGSIRNNNVKIGKLIVKRKFEKAILTILTDTSPKERPDIRFAREKLLKNKNYKDAAKYFPDQLRQEKQILQHLAKKPEDFIGALRYGERKGILMYVNALQSHIFNEILRRALEEGLKFNKKGQESCILAGYKTRFFEGRLGNLEREVLEENDLTLEDFNVIEIPYLRIKGSFRKAITTITDLKLEISEDEKFKGSKKINISFSLPSGVYATTYLDNFFEFN